MASLIDLHTHTSPASPCSDMTAGELIEAAIEARLDGVAVTDHLIIEGAEEAQELGRRKYGFRVFRGVEADTTIFGDVLVFGCYRGFPPRIPWHTLCRLVSESGGVLIPAHPFRNWDRRSFWHYLEQNSIAIDSELADSDQVLGIDAIEILNGGCSDRENATAAELARALVLPGIGGSDAHFPDMVGATATWFPGDISTDAELVAALKRGDFYPVDRRSGRSARASFP